MKKSVVLLSAFQNHFLVFSVCLFFLAISVSNAQGIQERSLELENLTKKSKDQYALKSLRVSRYAQENNVPIRFTTSDGRTVLMVDVDEYGLPVYLTTHNTGAALTTGVTGLQPGGALGLSLEGEGMFVGVWDGGSIGHSEFGERILGTQGSQSDHANHVTGTILATGINSNSRGMAPKAKAYTFDFDNDETEMLTLAKADQSSLLLSNHSYGLVLGWSFNGSWQWNGNSSISTSEDYRFGFYSSNAAFWDQMAFNAPYYTMVKSAGNDRNDTGSGTNPPDCNGGSGYDCIGDIGNAKNIITVGAVSKVFSYTGPASVGMSAFSSWGPTDDGRIKPDLVAAGVNLFSTVTNEEYESMSGTSMAAPNATGSLLLLQELYKNLNAGNFMKAATLKALAIHSTKEAGLHPGPDYKFGWGLLDVEAAAKILLEEDGTNIVVGEYTLTQGQSFELPLTPKPNEKITATLVWTDPAGSPAPNSVDPTKIMLVNDLDLRIVDDASNAQFPWILSPLDPDAAATRGDNIRDNVEKIEFNSPEPRNYKLVVSHKGSLQAGSQNFSLILKYQSTNDPRTTYYWVGNSGNWNDPAKWSLTSGGPSANTVPGPNDRVFIDENSFSSDDQVINVLQNESCGSITWLSDEPGAVSLNGFEMQLNGNLTVVTPTFNISTTGTVRFLDASPAGSSVNLGGSDMSNVSLVFQNGSESSWTISGDGKIGSVSLVEGDLSMAGLELELGGLHSTGSLTRSLDISNSVFKNLTSSNLTNEGIQFVSVNSAIELSPDAPAAINWNGIDYMGDLTSLGERLEITGTGTYASISIDGELSVNNDIAIAVLNVSEGSSIELLSGTKINLSENVSINSSPSNKVSILAVGANPVTLVFEEYFKLCFDNLIVDGVDVEGIAPINAGLNSEITNSTNWLEEDCDNVLFPKFSFDYSCAGSLISFKDESSGAIEDWSWNFGDPSSSENSSVMASPYHVFSQPGNYQVELTVSNANGSKNYIAELQIGENPMLANHVVVNFDDLFSFRSAPGYQWYKNEMPIEGAVSRAYNFNGEPGVYFVVTIDNDCNIKSSPMVISDTEDGPGHYAFRIFPNPASEQLTIEFRNEPNGGVAKLISTLGVVLKQEEIKGKIQYFNVEEIPDGLYFIMVEAGGMTLSQKVIIRK